jgi:hypothetical protein
MEMIIQLHVSVAIPPRTFYLLLIVWWFICARESDWTCFFFPVAPQSLKDLGRLTYRRFLELFRHLVGFLGRVISPSQGLYLHRTTQHRKTRTDIHALSGIRTHDPSNQPAKTHASDCTATVTSTGLGYQEKNIYSCPESNPDLPCHRQSLY